MKKSILLAAVALAALLSGLLCGEKFWTENRAALLVALSVVAAGTLVRLARGLPFTTPDHYELAEIRALTEAVSIMMAKLRILVIVIVGTMLVLVLVFPVVDFVDRHSVIPRDRLVLVAAALLGALHAYVFLRMYQVVQGDEDLTKLQSGFIERAVERRQQRTFDQTRDDKPPTGSSANYGRRAE